ncbi:hypothetical protein V9T40_007421 [Parthenolecanium corni]|uniref:Uncharacterized protein n=1 Tax=Parthenolecanium corni TaxID=536013 RepID=A0AAN9TWC2_9HEMI
MRNGQRPTPSEDYHRASRCESEIMATMSLRKNSRNSGPPPTSSVPYSRRLASSSLPSAHRRPPPIWGRRVALVVSPSRPGSQYRPF